MSLPKSPLTQKLARIFLLPAIVVCICSSNCPAYRLVGSEALSDALVAHHYSINATLDAVIVVDPTVPTFEYHTFFAMGHADEPEGEQGKLHFLEHIIAGTGSRPPGELEQLIRHNGGQSSASTSLHMTCFTLRFPKNKLELAVQIDRERFCNTLIDQKSIERERQVILTELSSRSANEWTRFTNQFWGLIYGRETFGGVGTRSLIKNIEPSAIRHTFEEILRRQRRLVAVVGHVDVSDVLAKLDGAFPDTTLQEAAEWPDPEFPNADVLGETHHVEYERSGVSRFRRAWRIPGLEHRDYAGFLVLNGILTRPSGSLRTALVDAKGVDEFRVWVENCRGFGLFNLEAEMQPATSIEAVDTAIRKELLEIRTKGVTENQLRAAQNMELSRLYSEFYDRSAIARRFGEAFALSLDPLRYPKLISEIQSVSAGDISRVALNYMSTANSVTLSRTPDEQNVLWVQIVVIVILISVPVGILLLTIWVVKKVIRKFSRRKLSDEQVPDRRA